MIELNTGIPGAGKTCYTLSKVKERAERESRPVFYHGIKELKLDWELLESPKDWASVPPNAIVVIDEAQKTFRNRSLGSIPDKFVTDLEEHRHLGIDLVLITQHPSLIDPAVRKLVGRHRHLVRIWGYEASTVHEWDSVKDNCDKSGGRKDSQSSRWSFDKAMYGMYKSAEVHTMKPSIPFRVKLLLALAFFSLCALVWLGSFFYKKLTSSDAPVADSAPVPEKVLSSVQSVPASSKHDPLDPRVDAQAYVWRETPRVAGVQYTAPKYDELTKPSRVPVPAACIQIGSVRDERAIRCKCYSQDGTPMSVEFNMCIKIAQEGVFLDFDPDPNKRDRERVAGVRGGPESKPNTPAVPPQNGSQVVSIGVSEPVPKLGSGKRVDTIQDGPPNNKATRAADFSAMPQG
ncbi:zonular occludens toxin domain-containing protein [Pseudoduganella sp. R-34]|uniref:zonular occludens toxin domain-containing protein n=1 Tax=Pseudoduganella sp. R-34 TaxID=3404062 RepID=UPI003CF62150